MDLAPPNAEVLYWLAYLRQDKTLLSRAQAASPALVFPFRTEAAAVFEWAAKQSTAWQPRYYLALLRWSEGEVGQARELLASCGDDSGFAPLYAARAQLSEQTAARDFENAKHLDPNQWRYGAMLARYHFKQNNPAAALAIAEDYSLRFPANGALALLHAKALLVTGRHQAAADLLSSLNLLPCEGHTEAHSLFRESFLMLAVERLKDGACDQALKFIGTAREWPEHLGAGKPYPSDLDERLEDWLTYRCQRNRNGSNEARQILERIIAFPVRSTHGSAGRIIRALALKASGRASEAEALLSDWLKEEPASELGKWGMEILSGRTAPLPSGIQDSNCRILSSLLEV
jgi:predicted Zn-dependent protease